MDVNFYCASQSNSTYKWCEHNFYQKQQWQIKPSPVGDSGYPLRPYLLTPISHQTDEAEEAYNRAHKKARRLIENAIGELKNRFKCLTKHGKH